MVKEIDIRQAMLRDAKIGWWQADSVRREFRLSDVLCSLAGLPDERIGFDRFRRIVPASYRQTVEAFLDFDPQAPAETTFPLLTTEGEQWFVWKRLDEARDGGSAIAGYARAIEAPRPAVTEQLHSERIDDLLQRLHSISQTLLSLRHSEQVDVTINRILSDMLAMFRGGRAYLIEIDMSTRSHRCTYEVTAKGVTEQRDLVSSLKVEDVPWWTAEMLSKRPVVLSSLDDLPEEAAAEYAVLSAQQIKSLIAYPLISRDRVWGYVGIDIVSRQREWTSVDCQWFSSLVNIVGLCIELQRSEQAAQDERAYLDALYRHMPMGYVRLRVFRDGQGKVTDYTLLDSNYAADEITERSCKEYRNVPASELGITDRTLLADLDKVLSTGVYLDRDTRMPTSNRHVHAILYSIRRDEVLCLFSDTTDVHNAHEALYNNERLLRSIYDNIPVGIEFYSKDGTLVDLNNKDMDMFGVARKEDVLGINFFDNPNVSKEILDSVRRGEAIAFRLYYPFDKLDGYYVSRKTGYIEIYSTVHFIRNVRGEVVNFMVTSVDNTEVNRAHTRLAEFESSFSLVSRFGKVGYCRYDLAADKGFAVPQWYRNLGEQTDTPMKNIIGVYSHVDPADRAMVLSSLEKLKAGQIKSFGIDLHILTEDGSERWTRSNVMRNPLNNDPAKIEVVSVNYDITELKLTEKNLIEAKNKAEVSDRLKSAFLANMSHEIRTPLNAIVGFSNLLNQTDDADERAEYMAIVQENNDLLLKLISDILDLSKIEAGTFEFSFGPVDVNQLCQEALRSLALKVEGKPVELRMGDHADACIITGDKNRLMQIITNFINNALKFTTEGHITLGYRLCDAEVIFSVEDTGTGIPQESLGSIFDRFVKLNSFVQGTGLGLSICKSIVEQMGDRIGVESRVGEGSRFWFSVPVAGIGDTARPALLPGDGRRPRLLVAEPADNNYLLLSLSLKKEFDLLRARDEAELARLCAVCRPDAVLFDVSLTGSDPAGFVRGLRSANPSLCMIAFAAQATERDRRSLREAGCADYFEQPLPMLRLKHRLHSLLAEKTTAEGEE